MRTYPLPAVRIQRCQACVLMRMGLRVRSKVHITTTVDLLVRAILPHVIKPVSPTIDTCHFASCASFAAAPFLEAITMHVVATNFAKNNRFPRFAIATRHCFVADGTVSVQVSLNSFLCLLGWRIRFWFGSCIRKL